MSQPRKPSLDELPSAVQAGGWPRTPLLSGQQHDAFGAIEDEFNTMLDRSIEPRGADRLFDFVAELALPAGAWAAEVGCGTGRHAVELARRFGFRVVGVDPSSRDLDVARQAFERATDADRSLEGRGEFVPGVAESLPLADSTVDLVWCRDVLCLVEDLPAAYAEMHRVLKPGGHAVVYQMFATDRLEPAEAAWLLPTLGCFAENMRPEYSEAIIRAAGLEVDRCVEIGTEWGEYDQEQTGKPGRKLLHAARLLGDPDRYIERFGRVNYDIALGDCLWHVYRMIGKLSGRLYVLARKP
ncbi:class I SAM-dependent methyltransferase [Piscinibacter sp.]|uniref:class I SAM-dependent methyltransferase n=1 Tax=Piscinibacter sp. TaxID=1903157 RepID=UPI002C8E453E|nr:methyltransferase domain-containing protein [Albitalea sp.]HUG24531.1 methyltransferase domain-containing protein [Albitalea sp.]